MLKRMVTLSAIGVAIVIVSTNLAARPIYPDVLQMHEWGTFTTVAGQDGRATNWLPLDGPTDLPCFVEHFQNLRLLKIAPNGAPPIDYASARSALWGKVRMETPVIYLYGPKDQQVNVRVQFPRGWITEWYPSGSVAQPYLTAGSTRDGANHTSSIEWKFVTLARPGQDQFPTERQPSHYYAARATEANALVVGKQSERFLFYRGVGDFDVPVTATVLPDGNMRVANLSTDALPTVVVFEKRGDRIGYRISKNVRGELTIAAPALDANFESLRADLERMLTDAGLYRREASAMVETWRDSWFEEGTRVFYVLPRRAVDQILPIDIKPAPETSARVFVGRMEVITPAMEHAVEDAIKRNDATVLARYGRFLGATTDRILARTTDAATASRIRSVTNAALASYVRRSTVCE